ncbi:MAG: MiaB/RimO family radical SAM methylthiotransferase [Phycisphaerales bacterium]|nr:MAG: MiaB/RimO family radical SAM methylthiotransferase [Phycisphaerales bacterium]
MSVIDAKPAVSMSAAAPRAAVYLETFGCQMNELDSELVIGQLRSLGYSMTENPEAAGVVLYNTCSVREHAEQKVWSRLGELKERKTREPGLVVGVLGCMAERDGQDLIRRMPVVDVMCGPGELDKLPALLDNAVRTRASLVADADDHSVAAIVSARQVALQGGSSRRSATLAAAEDTLEMLDLSRSISPVETGAKGRSAYVRITRGCNKFCTYCVVPFTRGAEIHRPPEHILEECQRLADAGVIEVTLLGQTVNHYRFEHGSSVSINGVMQPQKGRVYARSDERRDAFAGERVTTFADLLDQIHERVPAIRRLRFVTSYPRDFGDDVLSVIRDRPRICRYLHVPAQSGSDRMLKLMNRGYSVGEYLEFLDRARQFLDQPKIGRPLMLSGDFIVGFPTETEEDFEATRSLLARARYKNSFIFKYSPRPSTVAIDRFEDDVPESVKRRRNNTLLADQTEIGRAAHESIVGMEADVLVEGLSRRERKRREESPRHAGVALTIGGRMAGESASGASCGSACGGNETGESVSDTNADTTVQVSGRTDGDVIAFFEIGGEAEAERLAGRIVRVRIDSASALGVNATLITT